ncbi:TolC family outer membrane protein [Aliikangiella marina]|uniref:TolC family outer membrane protein n=1 Tax=Aliikangiella marina TaxID=1712262 RepID=A0A545T793_9GAMM|nr:TolC family outer membrane protein [Aliikangiella marina]TQV73052.1 TolC family outer membrane protein [Aliikangiella marina]
MNKPTKLAVGILAVLSSQTIWADNLLEVYNVAKDNDPTFLASDAGRLATNERVNQSMSSLLPSVNAAVGYSFTDSESTQTTTGELTLLSDPNNPQPFLNERFSESETTGSSWSVTLTQEVYNHASWLNLRQSEKRALQSNINHEDAKHDLIIRVAEAYFNVLGAMDNLDFSKAELEAVSKELAQTKQRFEVGLIAMTDVHEAQSRHDRAVANQISAQNGLDNAHEALQQVTGQYHYDLLQLKEQIDLRNPQPENIKEWVKQSEENNVSIKASRIGLDIAKKSIDIASAGHLPRVDFTARYSDSDRDTDSPAFPIEDVGVVIGTVTDAVTNNTNPTTSLSLDVSIPIYAGGNVSSRVKEAQNLYQQSAHTLEADRRRAVSETRSSYLGVVAAVSSVNALKQAVVSSQSALEATQAGFEVGTRTIVDVLLQTQQLYSAKRDHARARYDYILNTLKLKRAAGLLSEKDLEQVNGMLR